MKSLFHILLIGSINLLGFTQSPDWNELQLKSIHVLEEYDHIFDLSGIARIGDDLFVVNDQSYSRRLYQIELAEKSFHLVDSISLQYDESSDIEGLDYCENFSVFFTNEKNNQAYVSDLKGGNKVIFDGNQLDSTLDWGSNKGLEGIAVDCTRKRLYLAKEREPRFIVSYDIETKTILGVSMRDSLGDISDLKYENGFLYILERKENLVSKMDVETMTIVSKVSYKNTCSHPQGTLYSGTIYGMAEALLLTPDEIWIGLDNNGLYFSDYATKTYGLTGNNPVILRFDRPDGF